MSLAPTGFEPVSPAISDRISKICSNLLSEKAGIQKLVGLTATIGGSKIF